MFLFRQPTDAVIRNFLQAQRALDFTYPETGSTQSSAPACFIQDRTRVVLGKGEEVFVHAKQLLQRWAQFELGWLRASPSETPIAKDAVVAVVARFMGVWSLNAARIIYVIDEPRRFGFAYGTLPGHVEMGEERFLIERTEDDTVWYDILAFSRPRHLLAKLGYPVVRRLQKRFGRESAAAMQRAVRRTGNWIA